MYELVVRCNNFLYFTYINIVREFSSDNNSNNNEALTKLIIYVIARII